MSNSNLRCGTRQWRRVRHVLVDLHLIFILMLCSVDMRGKQTANPQLGSKPVGAFEPVFSSTKFHIVGCHGCFRGSWNGGTCEMGVKLVPVDAGDFCSLLTLLRMISNRE
jgi:hypothetical protein